MAMDDTSVYSGSLPDEMATQALAIRLAAVLQSGLVIYLQGDLGAGKTTFTRFLLGALGYAGKVKSPTYTLVESYPLDGFTVYHFDLYRFADPEEWDDAGFRDLFGQDSVCLVEWPDKADALLPCADLTLELAADANGRSYRLIASTDSGQSCLTRFSTQTAAS